ncbi:pilus assembly protein [Streptomyces sp. NBC_01317]|uniref:pilus assembly protein n=1 Tax=Streptomyces sp. NBC_01317 TaxID=2903822 RepID=UPI002E153626|nr:pilus assembly protein [Streptomyces sp. NBC_01317]
MNRPGTPTGIRTRYGEARRGDTCDAERIGARLREDRGQAAFEFTGMIPIILGTLVLLWQAALIGYTFSLAGNAADKAARAAAVGEPCGAAAAEDLPGAWSMGAVNCGGGGGDLVTVDIGLNTPVLFPGFNIPVNITAHGSALRETTP